MAHPHRDALTVAARVMSGRGMTQAAIAEAFGVSVGTIGYWLNPVLYEKRARRTAAVKRGEIPARKGPGMPEKAERNAAIVRMRMQGKTLATIAAAHSISISMVKKVISRKMKDRAASMQPRPAADLVSKKAQQAAAIRAKWLAFAQQNA